MKKLRRGVIGLALAMLLGAPAIARAALTCNGFIHMAYVGHTGNVVRVRISVGAGAILGGTKVTMDEIRFDLDCDSTQPLLPPCTDEGPVIEYEGDSTITTTCAGISWASNNPGGGTSPNTVTFTPTPALDIPALKPPIPGFCSLEFDVKIVGNDVDGSGAIDELVTFGPSHCDNGILDSGGTQTGDLPPTTTTTTTTTSTTTTTTTTSTTTTTTTTTTTSTTTSTTTTTTSTTTTTTVLLFTRTVGFWKNRPDLIQSIITKVGGSVTVCGQTITDVAVDDAHSALEALCGPTVGDDRFQCCRQLMAATLNGVAGGAVFPDLAKCNAICGDPKADDASVNGCEGAADTFNGSGDNVMLPFPEGNANSGPCENDPVNAKDTPCVIVDPTLCKVQ